MSTRLFFTSRLYALPVFRGHTSLGPLWFLRYKQDQAYRMLYRPHDEVKYEQL